MADLFIFLYNFFACFGENLARRLVESTLGHFPILLGSLVEKLNG